MTRFNSALVIVVVAGAILAGCGRRDAGTTEATSDGARQVESTAAPTPPATPGGAVTEHVAVGTEIHVAGTLGCGHCNFHATNECAAVVRTAAGDVYVLDGVDESSALWEKRLEAGHKIAVSGKLVGNDPIKHVAMTSFELE